MDLCLHLPFLFDYEDDDVGRALRLRVRVHYLSHLNGLPRMPLLGLPLLLIGEVPEVVAPDLDFDFDFFRHPVPP